ncbi:DEAD/DEAH box helicase [Prosthecobacter sp.]|uniref:DEAD/DEAH box helicase n=1 Tax=Prosthecobacter sp. TaxID=1965333 RepID=UPI003782DBED
MPPEGDWRTTDEDEINRRRLRAREEAMKVSNLLPERPLFSDFRVTSTSGLPYVVQIHDVRARCFSCDCRDYRINGLGTCKHIEAVLWQLQKRLGKNWDAACEAGSDRAEIVLSSTRETFLLLGARKRLPVAMRHLFLKHGTLSPEWTPEDAHELLSTTSGSAVRISNFIPRWLERRRSARERITLRRDYEQAIVNGAEPPQVTLMPLYPYQRDGMLHLAFKGRALLADEMGLGKTIQAISACALLHRLGKARRVLVVTPASLKTEWEEQIRKFTTLDFQIIYGGRTQRNKHYHHSAPFFTLMNYEQVRSDVLDINERLAPDIVVLDEAQRIKNWASGTARSIKLLNAPYAFVLTGTPLENRIDELYSLVDFLDPEVFSSLFQFNRQFYDLDEKGAPRAIAICANCTSAYAR